MTEPAAAPEHEPPGDSSLQVAETESSTDPLGSIPKPKNKKKNKKKKSEREPSTDRGRGDSARGRDRVPDAGGGSSEETALPDRKRTAASPMTHPAAVNPNPGGTLEDLEDVDDDDDGGGSDASGGDAGDSETLNEAAAAERERRRKKKKKKKKKEKEKKKAVAGVAHPLAPTVPEAHPTQAWAQIDPDDLVDSPHPSKHPSKHLHPHSHGHTDTLGQPGGTLNGTGSAAEQPNPTSSIRRTLGVLDASGFRRVSKRTLELRTADDEFVDEGTAEVAQPVGALMLQTRLETAVRTTLRYAVAITLGFVLANQVFVDALFKGNNPGRFAGTYAEVSTSEAALLFVLLTLSLGALFESLSLAGRRHDAGAPPARHPSPKAKVTFRGTDAMGVVCLGVAMVLHLVMMKTDIELDRFHTYGCLEFLSDYACGLGTVPPTGAAPGQLNSRWEDQIDDWRSLNLARLIAVCISGFGVLVA